MDEWNGLHNKAFLDEMVMITVVYRNLVVVVDLGESEVLRVSSDSSSWSPSPSSSMQSP